MKQTVYMRGGFGATKDRTVNEIERLKADLEEALARSRIDREQCDDMTREAGRLAEENSRLKKVIENRSARQCTHWEGCWLRLQKELKDG